MELCTYTIASLELSYKCRESKRTWFYTGEPACRADISAEISKSPSHSYDTTGAWLLVGSRGCMCGTGISASSKSFVFKK